MRIAITRLILLWQMDTLPRPGTIPNITRIAITRLARLRLTDTTTRNLMRTATIRPNPSAQRQRTLLRQRIGALPVLVAGFAPATIINAASPSAAPGQPATTKLEITAQPGYLAAPNVVAATQSRTSDFAPLQCGAFFARLKAQVAKLCLPSPLKQASGQRPPASGMKVCPETPSQLIR